MDPLAIAGLTIQVVGVYERFLGYRTAGDRFDIMRINLLTQRARLKYVIEYAQLGTFPQDLQLRSLIYDCLKAIEKEFMRLEKLEFIPQIDSLSTPTKLSSVQKIKFVIRDREQMLLSLTKITDFIDNIETVLALSSKGRSKEKSKGQRTFSPMPEQVSGSQKGDLIEAQGEEILFPSLVFLCEQTLKMVSSYSEALKEIFLSYLLWARTLSSENVFVMFTPSPAQIDDQQGPDLMMAHYELLAQVAWTLG